MKKQEDEKVAEIIEAEKVAKKGIMTILSENCLVPSLNIDYAVIDNNFQRVLIVLMNRELALKGTITITKLTLGLM